MAGGRVPSSGVRASPWLIDQAAPAGRIEVLYTRPSTSAARVSSPPAMMLLTRSTTYPKRSLSMAARAYSLGSTSLRAGSSCLTVVLARRGGPGAANPVRTRPSAKGIVHTNGGRHSAGNLAHRGSAQAMYASRRTAKRGSAGPGLGREESTRSRRVNCRVSLFDGKRVARFAGDGDQSPARSCSHSGGRVPGRRNEC